MSQYSDIASAIATAVGAVSDVGVVHQYPRWATEWPSLLDQLKTTVSGTVQLRGWMLAREGVEAGPGEAYSQVARQHRFVLVGVLGHDDATNTYATMQALAESVCDALDNRRDFSLSAVLDYSIGPCSIRSFETEMFGPALAHVVEIVVPVETVHAVTYS